MLCEFTIILVSVTTQHKPKLFFLTTFCHSSIILSLLPTPADHPQEPACLAGQAIRQITFIFTPTLNFHFPVLFSELQQTVCCGIYLLSVPFFINHINTSITSSFLSLVDAFSQHPLQPFPLHSDSCQYLVVFSIQDHLWP